MSYQVLARKYRPQRFCEIIGQDHITRTLQNAIAEKRLHHAYLFTGIRGIGKTTLARILSKTLNCESPVKSGPPEPCNQCPSCKEITSGASMDVQEIDGASNTGVDDVREIRERVKYLPAEGRYKIYIIDEVHMLSTPAFNALLKTLEEPPPHVIFIFATTESHKIPATILSRCQRYDFRRITSKKIIETLKEIAASEGVETDDECLEIIATESEGSMRDAESLFDQSIAYAGKKLAVTHLKELLGFLDRSQIHAAMKSVISRDAKAVLAIAEDLFLAGENLSRFVIDLLDMFHRLFIAKTRIEPSQSKAGGQDIINAIVSNVTIEECQQWLNLLYRGAEDISRSKFPKIILDVLLINMTLVRPVKSIDEILEKVESLRSGANTAAGIAAVPPKPQAQQAEPQQQADKIGAEANPNSSWPGFIDWLKLNRPQISPFLDNSSGIIASSQLTIKFPTKTFAAERIMEGDKKAFLEKLASDFFKKPVKILFEFENASENSASIAKARMREENMAKLRGIKEETLKHEIVREAVNVFGAEIREIKTK